MLWRYKLGILEGERTIYDSYFLTNADSWAPKHKLSREIVIVKPSKNNLVCKNAVTQAEYGSYTLRVMGSLFQFL